MSLPDGITSVVDVSGSLELYDGQTVEIPHTARALAGVTPYIDGGEIRIQESLVWLAGQDAIPAETREQIERKIMDGLLVQMETQLELAMLTEWNSEEDAGSIFDQSPSFSAGDFELPEVDRPSAFEVFGSLWGVGPDSGEDERRGSGDCTLN